MDKLKQKIVEDLDPREILAKKLIPRIYNNPDLSLSKKLKHFNVSWDIPRIGIDLDFARTFSPHELENSAELARNAVQLLFFDNSLIYSTESRAILNLPVDEDEFLSELRKIFDRLIDYDVALSNHPVAQLTRFPQDPHHQQILAIGALTKWALNTLKCRFPSDSEYYPYELNIEEYYGKTEARVSQIITFTIKSRCEKYDPMITPDQPDKVLAVLTELVETNFDRNLLDKRKIANLALAQRKILGIIGITIDDILSLHNIVLNGIQDNTGRFRSEGVFAGGDSRKKQPYEASQITIRLENLASEINKLRSDGDVQLDYEVIAKLAAEFQLIHPFQDGNGRVGHLITNFMLNILPPLKISDMFRIMKYSPYHL